MQSSTTRLLEAQFSRWPQTRATPIGPAEFDARIGIAGRQVDSDYRAFVLRYGGGIAGPNPVYGLRKPEFMGTIDGRYAADEITAWYRSQRWPGTEAWLVFSADHAGNPVGFEADGTVWISDHDSRQIDRIADGFEDYLLKWCFKTTPVG